MSSLLYVEFPFPGFELASLGQFFPEHLVQHGGPFALTGYFAPGNYGEAEEYDCRADQTVGGISEGKPHENNSDQQHVIEYAVGASVIDRPPQFIDLSI